MKIAVIDDMTEDRERLCDALRTILGADAEIAAYNSGEKFTASFRPNVYDVIFIDYYMKSLTGLETAELIRKQDEVVNLIFCTSTSEFAIQSFKVKACDYILKPYECGAIRKALELCDLKRIDMLTTIELSNGSDTERFMVSEIIYADMDGHYVNIHTKARGLIRIRAAFKEIMPVLLGYSRFVACYHGCLINMDETESMENDCFIMKNGERVPVKIKGRAEIAQRYNDYLFAKMREETTNN